MKNKFIRVIIVGLIVVVGVIILKDEIIRLTVQAGASKVLGTDIKIGGLSFGVLNQSVRVKDFKIKNPQGFPEGNIIDITEAGVDYDLQALLGGELHFPLIILNLNEMVVIRNKEGRLNVDSLKVAQQKEKAPAKEKREPSEQLLQIDELRLNINKVIYKDYTTGAEPSVQTFDVNLKDKVYKDIKSAQQLSALILVEAMKPTAIKGAKIYGVSTLLGVGALPAGIIYKIHEKLK